MAGVVLNLMKPDWLDKLPNSLLGHPSLPENVDITTGFICEAIATAFLVLCVFSAGVDKKASDAVVGIMVGSSLLLGVLYIGNTTGAALNPCRVLGPAILSGRVGERGHMIYYFGPIIGGISAGLLYKLFFIMGVPKRRSHDIDDKIEQPFIEN